MSLSDFLSYKDPVDFLSFYRRPLKPREKSNSNCYSFNITLCTLNKISNNNNNNNNNNNKHHPKSEDRTTWNISHPKKGTIL